VRAPHRPRREVGRVEVGGDVRAGCMPRAPVGSPGFASRGPPLLTVASLGIAAVRRLATADSRFARQTIGPFKEIGNPRAIVSAPRGVACGSRSRWLDRPVSARRSVKNAKSPLAPTDRSPSVRWAHRSQADLVAHLITQSRNRAPPWRRAQGCGRRLWCTRPMAHAGRARALTRTLNGSAFAAIWRGGRPLHTCAAYECSQRGAEIRPDLRPESRPDAATCGR
jgi:hypothetical protein